jgi:hypothetical protein
MIFRLIVSTIFVLFFNQPIRAQISSQEKQIPIEENGATFVDIDTLREIIVSTSRSELGESNQTVQKLDDFFSSAPIAISSQGQFTVLNPQFIFKSDKIPSDFLQRYPLFAVREPITREFALAYATFLSNSSKNLIPVLYELISSVDTSDWVQDNYSFYYLCLRTLAVTQVIDHRVGNCLNESLNSFKLRDTTVFVRFANIYMKLYRASRFIFESVSEKDRFYYPPNIAYKAIDTRAADFEEACLPLKQNYVGIGRAKSKIREDSLNRLPGGIMSSIAWSLFGRRQTIQDYNALFAMPDLNSISGPYFSTVGENGRSLDRWPDYGHLCGHFWY